MRNSTIIFSGLAVVAAFAGIGVASAADLPARTYTKAPVMVAPAFNWSGFYLGGSVGGHWGNDRITTTTDTAGGFGVAGAAAIDALSPTTLKPQGFIGGVQAGYNWQVNTFLVGVEADASWLDGTATRT